MKTICLVLAALLVAVESFYLPGVAPRKFRESEAMHIRMTTMTSNNDDLRRDYYSLNFCKPDVVKEYPENLGELLGGERNEDSIYDVNTLDSIECKLACGKQWKKSDIESWIELADDEYRVNMRLDNLPAAEVFSINDKGEEVSYYLLGYPLGRRYNPDETQSPIVSPPAELPPAKESKWVIYNHLTFTILLHRVNSSYEDIESSGFLVVGFEVQPRSVHHDTISSSGKPTSCEGPLMILDPKEDIEIFFTYDVQWKESDIKWASRWDVYLNMHQRDVHWFSVTNSFVVMVLLSGMVAMIMTRILRKDFYRYNRVEDTEEAREEMREETGWKLLYGDVFRAPSKGALFAVCLGSGTQVLLMATFGLICAALGVLSPSNRGGLMTVMLVMFVLMGVAAGYVSAYFCRVFHVTGRLKITLMTCVLIPGVVFTLFFLLNLIIWGEHSVGAVPFGTIVALCVIWFGVSVPLVFIGSFLGFRGPAVEPPVRTNSIPREIPVQPWYMATVPSVLMGAVLPFGVVFVELFFVLSAIAQHRFYYLFGFMFLVLIMLLFTCAEISIVMTYFQLCSEDHHWWWRSFLISGSSAFYFLLYSMFYYFHHLQRSGHIFASTIIYIGYSCIFAYLFFFMTGAAGFIPTYWFVRLIYGSIKVD